MSVLWAATSLESGRFYPGENRSDVSELSERFNELRCRGQGYLEARLADNAFPLLTLGFRDEHAVIHLFNSAEEVALLAGDGTVPPDAVVDVPILDDLAQFTRAFILSIDPAWDSVQPFTRTGSPSELGEWHEL
ncbi:hypothetical protein CS0771_54950 [Catellatospora sp. IY07-71]|uniref:hypothetical protein n=1 Tax=Catellatospora sp. IY07-71 TaxID=2728827 RepID=UPI001BB33CE3|nr:hypothetical protein [Catellatospora sp. IY07-71]BCJ75951.1 hypothetical protein CS0771_54950 [Catellatospora sp. IY07-71]